MGRILLSPVFIVVVYRGRLINMLLSKRSDLCDILKSEFCSSTCAQEVGLHHVSPLLLVNISYGDIRGLMVKPFVPCDVRGLVIHSQTPRRKHPAKVSFDAVAIMIPFCSSELRIFFSSPVAD